LEIKEAGIPKTAEASTTGHDHAAQRRNPDALFQNQQNKKQRQHWKRRNKRRLAAKSSTDHKLDSKSRAGRSSSRE
jgi:hypothetical protein